MFDRGDIVKIKENFWYKRYRDDDEGGKDPGVAGEMKQYAGKEYEVADIYNSITKRYILSGASDWKWDERWLEPAKNINIEEENILDVFNECLK